ncbi:MAG: hypothetical protein DHS20C18_18240 [Saprospiraceae bacterium]|nr:MAG: hypothetical protein DHS20C18_18240 [Saprospiraceae bacterium]
MLLTSQIALGQSPVIHTVTLQSADVEQYGKLEVVLDLSATYTNPYDYDQIAITALFTGPSGQQLSVDGFYMRDYVLNETTGNLIPEGTTGKFKLRFSPDQTGNWSFQVSVSDVNGTGTSSLTTFSCVPISNPENKGFVRSNLTNYLQFDNDEQYIPVGENIAWQNTNVFLDYRNWLTGLSENAGNFFRLWHAHWGLGIEWENGSNGFEGLRRYKETNSRYQDWIFDFCAENGLYVMLCLQHHGQVSSQVNPNWNDSPYNVANGGPCNNTWDFFTNETAKAHTKNRLRYVVARWGYSRSIMSWELFNEVGWTDDFSSHQSEIADWHAEMAVFLKENDPYRHLVTTSYAGEDQDPAVWANPDFDFTQTHYYLNLSNLERALVGGVRSYLEDFGKPTLTGEFGLGGSSSLTNADPDGIHIHNALWGTLFGGGMGSAMTWWWDSYIHPRNLYYHFAPVTQVAADIPFLAENMSPGDAYAIGAPGNLVITPTLGWAGIGDAIITINENGSLTPENPGLGIFLYGSEWNTELRSPPTFELTYPSSGQFTVKTNSDSGTDPKIAIYLDGVLMLEEMALVNQSYSINVPQGSHTIKVDNTGTDWISIAAYTFEGIGSQMDTYVLSSENQEVMAGWVLNNSYNHEYLADNGAPDPIFGGELVIDNVISGNYLVNWYDCLTGAIVHSQNVNTAIGNQLFLPVPELFWDLAFHVQRDGEVSTSELAQSLPFKVYPNPALPGERLTIEQEEISVDRLKISLLDAAGKQVQIAQNEGFNHSEFSLANNLPAGFYWLKVEGSGKVGTKPVVVSSR